MTGTICSDRPGDRRHPFAVTFTFASLVAPPVITTPASIPWTWSITVIIILTLIILGVRLQQE
ncbi:hypothetical protein ACFW84_11200 [Streptomyces anulatus]|uniref:hypothetical protein n=1 Tax=Streptomyces anulatus TaxID=1892 RepID=UPI00369AEC49